MRQLMASRHAQRQHIMFTKAHGSRPAQACPQLSALLTAVHAAPSASMLPCKSASQICVCRLKTYAWHSPCFSQLSQTFQGRSHWQQHIQGMQVCNASDLENIRATQLLKSLNECIEGSVRKDALLPANIHL